CRRRSGPAHVRHLLPRHLSEGAKRPGAMTLAKSDSLLELVTRAGKVVQYRAKRPIFREGDPPEHVFYLIGGAVRLFHRQGEDELCDQRPRCARSARHAGPGADPSARSSAGGDHAIEEAGAAGEETRLACLSARTASSNELGRCSGSFSSIASTVASIAG